MKAYKQNVALITVAVGHTNVLMQLCCLAE